MTPIGGFLDLEVGRGADGAYHRTAALSTGRACLLFILQSLNPSRVYLPYYICDAVLEPFLATAIPYRFYHLSDSLEISDPPSCLQQDELLLYVNYFGLKTRYLPKLEARYRDRLLVDDTQGFFQQGYREAWSFNSARKFFGVPDGAYLYGPDDRHPPEAVPAEPGYAHLISRMGGDRPDAYRQFLEHEAGLDCRLRSMSLFSLRLLRQVDYAAAAERRRLNFLRLHEALGPLNSLDWCLREDEVPLYYPFLSPTPIRQGLIERKIFVPRLWPEVITRPGEGYAREKRRVDALSPLPLDQRYDYRNMDAIIEAVKELL